MFARTCFPVFRERYPRPLPGWHNLPPFPNPEFPVAHVVPRFGGSNSWEDYINSQLNSKGSDKKARSKPKKGSRSLEDILRRYPPKNRNRGNGTVVIIIIVS